MSAWTYSQLKAAYVAIGSPSDLGAAAATLNAQTQSPSAPVLVSDVTWTLALSATYDLARIVLRASQAFSFGTTWPVSTLTTNGATTTSSPTLHFASVPASVVA